MYHLTSFAMLNNFTGDLNWVHAREGHAGKPYWPGGQSGVTLDPGVDLGYIDESVFYEMYEDMMSEGQIADVRRVLGIKGDKANRMLAQLQQLKKFRISRFQAEHIFPYVADDYWVAALDRWSGLLIAPPSVHTAVLSLVYNRGANNRHLDSINKYFENQDWEGLGNAIKRMQQNHKLPGIRKRRRQEGNYILDRYEEEVKFPDLNRMEPKPLENL